MTRNDRPSPFPPRPSAPRTLARLVGIAALALLAGCTASSAGGSGSASAPRAGADTATTAEPGSSTPPSTAASTSRSNSAPAATPVHVRLKFGDGQTFGVGIPVIAFFSHRVSDARALQRATTVTVDGQAVTGGRWYFEPVVGHPGYPVEGDFRLRDPWPAHADVQVRMPAKGLSAGRGLAYDDSLSLRFHTGAAQIAVVDESTHRLTLTVDGKVAGRYPVSLGARATPTAHGTKVIMEKGASICMSGPGYHECGVRYTQRLTYGGEYLHAAPWNCVGHPQCVGPQHNIGSGDSSNGCTNLLPVDAQHLYATLRIGDIVKFPNADGPKMTMAAGYGDWNVSWTEWLTGGDTDRS